MSNPKSPAARKFKTEGRVANFHENGKKIISVYKFKSPSGVWLFPWLSEIHGIKKHITSSPCFTPHFVNDF